MSPNVVLVVFLLVSLISLGLNPAKAAEISNAPKISDLVDKLNYPEGTNAQIMCSVGSGDLSSLVYEWKKDEQLVGGGGELRTSRKLKISTPPENDHSLLRVSNLSLADSGVYTCIARNKYGQDKATTRLNVKVQLKWLEQPGDVEIGAGKPLEVPCSADSFPKPTIEWFKLDGGVSLGPELRLASAQPSDAGQYECRARNGIEKDLVARIEVKVLGK